MNVTKSAIWTILAASIVLLSCETENPHRESRSLRELQKADIDSFKGKTVGAVLASIKDSAERVFILHEPPGYLSSVSYFFGDGYRLDFLIEKVRFQSPYNENQEWDTLRLRLETASEISVRHHLDIIYGRRFN